MDPNDQLGLAGPLNIKSEPMDTSQSAMDLPESSALNMTADSMPADLHSMKENTTDTDQNDDDESEDDIFFRQDNRTYQCKFCPEVCRYQQEIRKHTKLQHPSEWKSFKCVHCNRRFASGSIRDRHVDFHSLNHPFKCTECDQMYRSKERLANHFQLFHDKNSHISSKEQFHCGSCELTFVEKKYYDLHSRIYHGRKPQRLKILSDKIQVCERCVKIFDSRDLLMEHTRQTHKGDPPLKNFICKMCSKDLKKVTLLRTHILVAHFGIMPFVCQHCRAEFSTRHWLMKHMEKDHPEVALFKCPSCDEFFTTESRLTEHNDKVHVQLEIEYDPQTGKTIYPCGKCEKKLESKDLLDKHLVKAHPSFILMYKCPLCSQSVRCRKQHMRVHHDIEYEAKEHNYLISYKCHCCSKLFQQKRNLLAHQNSLSNQCGRCQMRFKTKKSLQVHMVTHRGTTSFECEDCALSFSSRGRLEAHRKRYHSPTSTQVLKIIKCPYCSKLFTKPNNWKRHIAVNHVQSEFKVNCGHCPEQVTDTVLLRKHYKTVHPEKRVTFKCPECEMFYLYWHSFKYHYKKHMKKGEADDKAEMNKTSEPVEDGVQESGQTNIQNEDGELESIVIKEEAIVQIGSVAASGGMMMAIKQETLDNGEASTSTDLADWEKSTGAEETNGQKGTLMEKQKIDFVVAKTVFQKSTMKPLAAEQPEPLVEHQVVSTESAAKEKPVFLLTEELKQKNMELDETIDRISAEMPARQSNKTLKCEDCGLDYGCQSRLEAHRKRYHSPTSTQVLKIMNCPYCPMLFTSPISRSRHIGANHEQTELQLICAHCPLQVTDTVQLRKHFKRVHPQERVVFKCPWCEKFYLHLSSFKDHYSKHRKEAEAHDKEEVNSTSILSQSTMDVSESSGLHMTIGSMPTDLNSTRDETTATKHEDYQDGDDESEDETFFRLDSRTYQCKFCPEIFHLLREIQKHTKVKHPSKWKNFKCMHCKRWFPSELMRDRHVHFHSLNHPFKCTECDQMYTTRKRLENHFQVFHDKNSDHFLIGRFHCGSCELTFVEKKYYDLHLRIYHDRKSLRLKNLSNKIQVCERCVKTFDSRHLLMEHIRQTHQGDPPLKNCICKTCSKDLKRVDLLRIHILVDHFGIMPFICQHCNADFASRHLFLKHIEKDHSEVALFKCPSCDESFVTEARMTEHQDKAHMNRVPVDLRVKLKKKLESKGLLNKRLMNSSFILMYKCPLCSQTVLHRNHHMRIDHEDVEYDAEKHQYQFRYKCRCCSKLFQQKRNLVIHQNSLPNQCGRCHMRFKTKMSLEAHMAFHRSRKKSFECKDCGLDCSFRVRLEEHRKRYHSPTSTQVLKIINCPYCPKVFTSSSNRVRHIAVNHAQCEFKVNCAHCPVQMTDTVLLRKHYRKVHPEERVTFKCPECEKLYMATYSIKDHYNKHRKEARAEDKAETNSTSEPVEDGVEENYQAANGELESIVVKEEAIVQIENAASPGVGVTAGIRHNSLDIDEPSEQVMKTEIKQEPLDNC